MVNKAIILAGGKGIRFNPITNYFPKCMIPILGRPILDYNVELCKKYGIEEIYICSGYKSKLIRDYYRNEQHIKVIEENIELGTGGAIKELFGDQDCIVMNGDSIYQIDIQKLRIVANKTPCEIIMGVHYIKDTNQYGFVVVEPHTQLVREFKEKPIEKQSGYVSIGLYYFKETFKINNRENPFIMLETDIFPEESKEGNILAYMDCNWFPIDSEDKYKTALEGITNGN